MGREERILQKLEQISDKLLETMMSDEFLERGNPQQNVNAFEKVESIIATLAGTDNIEDPFEDDLTIDTKYIKIDNLTGELLEETK